MEIAILNVGAFKVEIKREGDFYEFRPLHTPDHELGDGKTITNFTAVEANMELRIQGGAWAVVPPDLLPAAKSAFKEEEDV